MLARCHNGASLPCLRHMSWQAVEQECDDIESVTAQRHSITGMIFMTMEREGASLGVALPPGATAHIDQRLFLELGPLLQTDLIELFLASVQVPLSADCGGAVLYILRISDQLQDGFCTRWHSFVKHMLIACLRSDILMEESLVRANDRHVMKGKRCPVPCAALSPCPSLSWHLVPDRTEQWNAQVAYSEPMISMLDCTCTTHPSNTSHSQPPTGPSSRSEALMGARGWHRQAGRQAGGRAHPAGCSAARRVCWCLPGRRCGPAASAAAGHLPAAPLAALSLSRCHLHMAAAHLRHLLGWTVYYTWHSFNCVAMYHAMPVCTHRTSGACCGTPQAEDVCKDRK